MFICSRSVRAMVERNGETLLSKTTCGRVFLDRQPL
jgi:uncharacterized C2H2 Zn-finger protein